ncbi:MAG: SHOCT domain-containing protein [Clostridia bacterium]
MANTLLKKIEIPEEQRKKTSIISNIYYDALEIYDSKIDGYQNGTCKMTWQFSDYKGIDVINANMNSQFGQVVFLTGINSNNRFAGFDFGGQQNASSMNDTNRILFSSGMFGFKKTNEFTESIGAEIRNVYNAYREMALKEDNKVMYSDADELAKFKQLLDAGIITQDEFSAKKRQILGL